jgi:hypothetical protein
MGKAHAALDVGVGLAVGVALAVGTGVAVGAGVGVAVAGAVGVAVVTGVGVAVAAPVAVGEAVATEVAVAIATGVGVCPGAPEIGAIAEPPPPEHAAIASVPYAAKTSRRCEYMRTCAVPREVEAYVPEAPAIGERSARKLRF